MGFATTGLTSSQREESRMINYRVYARLKRDCPYFDDILPIVGACELADASRALWNVIANDPGWIKVPTDSTGPTERKTNDVSFVLFELLDRIRRAGYSLPEAWNAILSQMKSGVFAADWIEGRVSLRVLAERVETWRLAMDPMERQRCEDEQHVWKSATAAVEWALNLGMSLDLPLISKACSSGEIQSRQVQEGKTRRLVEMGSFVRWLLRRKFREDRIRDEGFREGPA